MTTTDSAVRAHQAARPADQPVDEIRQQKPQQPPSVFFPLGYKEAAYQWVSPSILQRRRSKPMLLNPN